MNKTYTITTVTSFVINLEDLRQRVEDTITDYLLDSIPVEIDQMPKELYNQVRENLINYAVKR